MREPPCGGFPWGTRQNWTLTDIHIVDMEIFYFGNTRYIIIEQTYIGKCQARCSRSNLPLAPKSYLYARNN